MTRPRLSARTWSSPCSPATAGRAAPPASPSSDNLPSGLHLRRPAVRHPGQLQQRHGRLDCRQPGQRRQRHPAHHRHGQRQRRLHQLRPGRDQRPARPRLDAGRQQHDPGRRRFRHAHAGCDRRSQPGQERQHYTTPSHRRQRCLPRPGDQRRPERRHRRHGQRPAALRLHLRRQQRDRGQLQQRYGHLDDRRPGAQCQCDAVDHGHGALHRRLHQLCPDCDEQPVRPELDAGQQQHDRGRRRHAAGDADLHL
jgi:hypothetical protein